MAVVFWDQHLKTLPLQVKLLAVQVRFGKSACAAKERNLISLLMLFYYYQLLK